MVRACLLFGLLGLTARIIDGGENCWSLSEQCGTTKERCTLDQFLP